jgi:hypothetical protein
MTLFFLKTYKNYKFIIVNDGTRVNTHEVFSSIAFKKKCMTI